MLAFVVPAFLFVPALLFAQVRVSRSVQTSEDAIPDSIRARRIAVTAQHLATAFKDSAARDLFRGAQRARMQQDSLLRGYDAMAYQRVSVGLSFRASGRDRLLFRHESVAHVRWSKSVGAHVELKGARAAMPMIFADANSGCTRVNSSQRADPGPCVQADLSDISPIPYYPGSDALWIGFGRARRDVSDDELVHPLARGAEAYYRYETGDSILMRIGPDRSIRVRELRVIPREPKWNVSVGSYWFDVETNRLVRAVYRLAVPLDIWQMAEMDSEEDIPAVAKALMNPMRATMSSTTVEYGLFEGRFWLPRLQIMEGRGQASFVHVPVTFEQRFEYASVNGDYELPAMPRPASWLRSDTLRHLDSLATEGDTVARRQAIEMRQRLTRDSEARREQQRIAREARLDTLRNLDQRAAAGDSAARALAADMRRPRTREISVCDTGTVRTRLERRDGLPVLTEVPCDPRVLINSPDLPPNIFDPGEQLFQSMQRDELLKRLDFGLQAGWSPQRPTLRYGLGDGMMRYNRVEGFSPALGVNAQLGLGLEANALVRMGTADKWLNAEFGVSRSDGSREIGLNAYRRLTVANDWGTPLTFSSSVSSLLFARDEGFYYRAWGAELKATTSLNPEVTVRLFAEEQLDADVNTQMSLAHALNDVKFIPNLDAERGWITGAAMRIVHSLGYDPNGLRLLTDVRAEEGVGDLLYGRVLADVTVSHGLGRRLAGSLTASAGYASDRTPAQRLFYLGGSPTIRGQKPGTAVGPTYWFGRAELGSGSVGARRVLFADLGWAGQKSDWSHPGRPLSGVGIGMSFMDGLIRFDLSRGLYPRKAFTFDAYFEARF